jgi:hypothetical protein
MKYVRKMKDENAAATTPRVIKPKKKSKRSSLPSFEGAMEQVPQETTKYFGDEEATGETKKKEKKGGDKKKKGGEGGKKAKGLASNGNAAANLGAYVV